jgi:lipoprotein-anchoring transpeptidase ErfK/SrfK
VAAAYLMTMTNVFVRCAAVFLAGALVSALGTLSSDALFKKNLPPVTYDAPDQANLVPLKGEDQIAVQWRRTPVSYRSGQKPGTLVIDTSERYLYLITGPTTAIRYGVAVGRDGFEWEGAMKVTKKVEWPDWRPPKDMIEREKKKGKVLPAVVPGGPGNPLGARALYLGRSEYRIHGTNAPKSIGQAASSGCIRMLNEHVIDLYGRVPLGTRVVVTT